MKDIHLVFNKVRAYEVIPRKSFSFSSFYEGDRSTKAFQGFQWMGETYWLHYNENREGEFCIEEPLLPEINAVFFEITQIIGGTDVWIVTGKP